jgi:hypothetical protein
VGCLHRRSSSGTDQAKGVPACFVSDRAAAKQRRLRAKGGVSAFAPTVLAFGIIENGHSWLFWTKMGVVWPMIINKRLVNLTPHMFPCHRSHSLISGGDHFWVKNPNVLAFSDIENGR